MMEVGSKLSQGSFPFTSPPSILRLTILTILRKRNMIAFLLRCVFDYQINQGYNGLLLIDCMVALLMV
jgi:hypothetical protein